MRCIRCGMAVKASVIGAHLVWVDRATWSTTCPDGRQHTISVETEET